MPTNAKLGWLLVILLAALGLRVAAAVVWQQRLADATSFAFPDSESYWELGRRIACGDAYEFSGARAFRTPGYPLALAPLFWVFRGQPPVLAARMVGAVLGTVAVGGIAWLARKLFNERAMLIAALMAAVYLEAIAMSVLVLSEALFCPLMVGQLLLWTCVWQSRERKSIWACAIGAGVCAGLAVLTRPSWLLFTPLAMVVSLAFSRKTNWEGEAPAEPSGSLDSPSNVGTSFVARQERRPPNKSTRPPKAALAMGFAILMALLATMSPWWIRNYVVLHAFVPTSTETGPSLYDGLHAGATGASDMRFVPRVAIAFDESHPEHANSPAAREIELNRYFAREAIAWARANPRRVVELAWIKLGRMWNIWPNEASLRSWPLRLAVAAGYVPLLILGLISALRFARRDWPYALCVLPAFYFSLLHMVFVGSIRYRQPAMLLLIVLAAGAVDWLVRLCKGNLPRPLLTKGGEEEEPPPAPP